MRRWVKTVTTKNFCQLSFCKETRLGLQAECSLVQNFAVTALKGLLTHRNSEVMSNELQKNQQVVRLDIQFGEQSLSLRRRG